MWSRVLHARRLPVRVSMPVVASPVFPMIPGRYEACSSLRPHWTVRARPAPVPTMPLDLGREQRNDAPGRVALAAGRNRPGSTHGQFSASMRSRSVRELLGGHDNELDCALRAELAPVKAVSAHGGLGMNSCEIGIYRHTWVMGVRGSARAVDDVLYPRVSPLSTALASRASRHTATSP